MLLEKKTKTRRLVKRLLELEDKISGMAFPKMKRVKQVSASHCGPAVLEELFSFLGARVSQASVVRTLRASKKIRRYGLNIGDLARATKTIGKGKFVFWKKANSGVNDLSQVVNKFKYPAGVEWQGVFYEDDDGDSGHYSIVTKVEKRSGFLKISDPYSKFAGTDRKFKILNFQKRWWDQNEVKLSGTSKRKIVTDKKVMFLITPKGAAWPKKLGMVRAS